MTEMKAVYEVLSAGMAPYPVVYPAEESADLATGYCTFMEKKRNSVTGAGERQINNTDMEIYAIYQLTYRVDICKYPDYKSEVSAGGIAMRLQTYLQSSDALRAFDERFLELVTVRSDIDVVIEEDSDGKPYERASFEMYLYERDSLVLKSGFLELIQIKERAL